MGIVLGKPSNVCEENWSIKMPLDAPIPLDRSHGIPAERQPFEKPTQSTHRLIEYRVLSQLPGIQRLLIGEFNPRDFAQVQQYQQKMWACIETVPPPFRFENPDRKWDVECPWLKPQREYLCCTTWLFFLVTYRYSMFTIPQSRTEVIKSGIKVLQAQERHYRALGAQHYKLYALAFFTLEAATAIMVVFIAFPAENKVLFPTALFHIKESIARMNAIKCSNQFARPAAELLELLMLRAESVLRDLKSASSNSPGSSQENTPQYINSELTPLDPGEKIDFSDYPPSQTLNPSHSDAGSTPPNFDFTCGGIIGPFGPTAQMLEADFMVPDTWDPMILLERSDDSFVGDGYRQDMYE
jgi:hypothetical protein